MTKVEGRDDWQGARATPKLSSVAGRTWLGFLCLVAGGSGCALSDEPPVLIDSGRVSPDGATDADEAGRDRVTPTDARDERDGGPFEDVRTDSSGNPSTDVRNDQSSDSPHDQMGAVDALSDRSGGMTDGMGSMESGDASPFDGDGSLVFDADSGTRDGSDSPSSDARSDADTETSDGSDSAASDAPSDAASERGEDCDVQVGGNCQCLNGQTRSCGQCNAGTETCSNGTWGTCMDVLIATPARGPRMLCVPGNTFSMGSNDVTLPDDSRPVHSVTLPAFWMDETEVTSAQYEQCVTAGACAAVLSGSGCNFGVAGRGNYPANCLDVTPANAFCIWAGKRLPIEEEWEYAARGTDGRSYPWGNAAPGTLANWNNLVVDGTQPVGSYLNGRSPFGLFDMAGNVAEWTSSQWCPYPASGITPPCGSQPIIYRGGGFNDADATALNGAHRYYDVPPFSPTNVGVRCAKSL